MRLNPGLSLHNLGPRLFVAGALLATWAVAPAVAEKTDRISVSNGNEIVGEIKNLERGSLLVKTDFMRSVTMDWAQISRIASDLDFEVETQDGQLYFGALAPSDEDRILVVIGELGSVRLAFGDVTQIHQTASRRLGHLEARVALGASYTQASDVTKLSLDSRVARRTHRFLSRLDLVVIVTDTADETSSREDLSYTFSRKIKPRWNYDLGATLQANEELGLNSRALLRGGVVAHALRSDRRDLSLGAGLAVSEEEYTGEMPGETSLEGTLSLHYFAFHFDDPEMEFTLSVTLFPSLTNSGRLRGELRAEVLRELVNDLYWSLSVFESYDSAPVGSNAVENDLAVTMSLGFKF